MMPSGTENLAAKSPIEHQAGVNLCPMKFEVRYERAFMLDLKKLETVDFQKVYKFVFDDFFQFERLTDLPELRQIRASAIFYRFTLDNYIIGIEVTGQIVKFLRILPKPDI